jgi:cardiolipin synthase
VSSAVPPVGAGEYRLVQYPQAGFGGVYAQTMAARHSIDMEMYELADTTEEADLAAAAARHVAVRVLLDSDFSGREINQPAYDYLSAHGVRVRWAPTGVIFHIKATTFDRSMSDVSTANLTSRYYADTRDAEIIDTNPAQVKAIEASFAGDWGLGVEGRPSTDTVQAAGLVWSPDTGSGTAQDALVEQIEAARHSVFFESEELGDAAVYGALAADARRGITCDIVMTESAEWVAGFTAVTDAGCQVHVYPDRTGTLYIHEKLILDDASTSSASLLLGSQNASVTSLTRNRELGLLLSDAQAPAVISAVAAAFRSDYTGALPWSPAPTSAASSRASGPASHAPVSTPAAAPTTRPAASCTPLSDAGHCYKPGEACRASDHGRTGTDADGQPIRCDDNDGWRWEQV